MYTTEGNARPADEQVLAVREEAERRHTSYGVPVGEDGEPEWTPDPGYWKGVRDAIDWVLGLVAESPLEE